MSIAEALFKSVKFICYAFLSYFLFVFLFSFFVFVFVYFILR